MKLVSKKVRNGLTFACSTPETPQEYDTLAKRQGACVDDANDNTWYRSVLPDAWELLAAKLEDKSGIARKVKPHPDGRKDVKGNTIMVDAESDPQYVDRVAAEQGVDSKTFQPIVDEHVNPALKFDPSVRERKPRVPTVGKGDREFARELIAEGPQKLAGYLNKIVKVTGEKVVLTGNANADELLVAQAVKAFRNAAVKQLKA